MRTAATKDAELIGAALLGRFVDDALDWGPMLLDSAGAPVRGAVLVPTPEAGTIDTLRGVGFGG